MEQGARVLKSIGDKIMSQNEQARTVEARCQKLKASIGIFVLLDLATAFSTQAIIE